MKYILFIIGLVLWAGISARSKVRKQLSDLEDASNGQQTSSSPAYESLFAEHMQEKRSFAEEEAAAGYFTYETEKPSDESQTSQSASVKSPFVQTVKVANTDEGSSTVFDLRQAIVYNTILKAKYIPEVNLHEIN